MLIVATVVMLVLVVLIGGGVLMANVMACDSGAEGCAERATTATLVWAALSFLGPIAAMIWGLIAKRTTSGGRISRIIALVLIILLPVIALALNLVILFVGTSG